MKRATILIMTAGFFYCVATQAELYKWVDENGDVHYTQTKPNANISVESIKPPPSVDTENAASQFDDRQKLLDSYATQRDEDKKRREHELKEKQKAKQNCQNSRDILTKLQTIRKVNIGDDGTDDLATEKTKQEKMKQVKENIKKWCN